LKYDFWKCDNFNLLSAELLINLFEFLHQKMEISDSLEIQDQSQVFGATQDQDQESDEELLPQNKFPALDPTRSGFMPVVDLDIVVEPGINLLSQFVDQHKEDSRSNRKMLFESFYSLFCVLALESLMKNIQRPLDLKHVNS